MSESQIAPMGPAMPIPMPNEPDGPTYIPEFAPRFTELDLTCEVTLNGEGVGFCVGDVHPARRWACSKVERSGGQPQLVPSGGELLSDRDFAHFYRRYSARVCTNDGRIVALSSVSKFHNPEIEPLPSPLKYVNRKLDPEGKGIPITFDPNTEPEKKADKTLYRADGEPFEPGEKDMTMKMKGVQDAYTAGAFGPPGSEAADAALGRAVAVLLGGGTPGAQEPSRMPVGFDAVKPSDEEEPEPEPVETAAEIEARTAKCGRICKNKTGRMAHERRCEKCNPPTEDDAA